MALDLPPLRDERVSISVDELRCVHIRLWEELLVECLEGTLHSLFATNSERELHREAGVARELDEGLEAFGEGPVKQTCHGDLPFFCAAGVSRSGNHSPY